MTRDAELTPSSSLVLGRYRVVQRLARGGMGVVYLGRLEGAAGFAKPVVIKRILPEAKDSAESTALFIREAQILSHLQHPCIVGVLDFGEEHGGHAMILEYVHGYDLGRWLKYLQLSGQRLHWEEAVFILLRVLDALSYAHGFRRSDGTPAQVLHRDISPGNVLIDVEGRVRLLDFGIARMAEDAEYRTQTGVLKGKVPFLAPELFSGEPPSAASDLYACGVVLYQVLTGNHPFTGENDNKLMWRIVTEWPKPLSHARDDLPAGLEEAILTALAKQPENRQASAELFATELRETLIRREAEIEEALRERVKRDFYGEMPERLRLEPLADRDRAWRTARASLPPEPALPRAAARDRAEQHIGPHDDEDTTLTGPSSPSPPPPKPARTQRETLPPSSTALPMQSSTPRSARRPEWRSLLLVSLGIGLVVAAALVLTVQLLQQRAAPAGARFIVVESPDKQTRAAPTASAEAPVALAPPAGSLAPPPLPTESPRLTDERAAEARPKVDPADARALSQRFAKNEAALQRCFERFASELSGQPKLAVLFRVTPAGKVQSAQIEPRSLDDTPLGACLLEVARGTAFGAVGKTLEFSIPIRARSVTR